MGTYVEDYLESMYLLPSELKRNFDLMRELDKTSYPLLEELKESQKAYLTMARQKVLDRCADTTKGEATDEELRELIEADAAVQTLQDKHALVVQKLDEKIAIAAQSYDIVDHHIRRLDRDLDSYAKQLKASGDFQEDSRPQRKKQKLAASAAHQLGQPGHATPHVASVRSKSSSSGGALKDKAATPAVSKASGGGSSSSRKRSVAEAAAAVPVAAAEPVLLASEDLPIDPNEPIYCSCRRVSFGQMVGCDNDDCKYEWFHFGCVGLTDQPAGKWYCQDCKAQLGIK